MNVQDFLIDMNVPGFFDGMRFVVHTGHKKCGKFNDNNLKIGIQPHL